MRLKYTLIFLLFASFAQAQQKPLGNGSTNKKKQPATLKKTATTTQGNGKVNIKPTITNSPSITGIWRGYFVQKDFNPFTGLMVEDRYKYEVQINQLFNNALQGVTYSYKTTVFYGKTSLQGIFTKGTKNVLIKELKMLELKIADMSEPCMMTCNLEYAKNGNKETLTGVFTSINTKNKKDCGEGSVYLEKVPESDFEKEDFLQKKKPEPLAGINKIKPLPYNAAPKKLNLLPLDKPTTPSTGEGKKPKIKPGAEDALVKKDTKDKPKIIEQPKSMPAIPEVKNVEPKPFVVLPKELTERTNNLVKTMYVDEGEIEISLYDNGEIDNDTVTVYHNNEMVIPHGRLSAMPLTVKIKVDAEHPIHEFIMVADNLGEIPPNTSLMTITAGKKQYSVFLTSDESKNAKVIIQYKPQQENSKFK